MVSEIRKIAQDDTYSADFKKAVAKRLNKLATTKDAFEREISKAADPQNWWATFKPGSTQNKIAPDDQPVMVSGSGLATLRDCGLKWFLEKKAGANVPRQNSASIGSIVHALAQGLSNGEIEPDIQKLKEKLDQIWPQLSFEADWISQRSYDETLEIISNLLNWHLKRTGRKVVGAEVNFSFEISVDKDNPNQKVKVSGFIDRVESEIDDEKRLHIIDFKTSKYTLTKEQADEDPQLGVYRLAVTQKSLKADVEPESVDAGASLVYLKHLQKNGLKELLTASIEENGILEILKESFRKIKNEDFSATISPLCRTCQFIRMCPAQSEGKGVVQ